jgi:hypothetical protein
MSAAEAGWPLDVLKNPATLRFAHSGPGYIGETFARSPEALEYFRTWIDAEIGRIQRFPSGAIAEDQRAELISLSRKARQAYE